MTIPGTGQKWRGRGGDILIAADTDGSHEMDWKAGTRVVDFSFSGLDAIPEHKVVPASQVKQHYDISFLFPFMRMRACVCVYRLGFYFF